MTIYTHKFDFDIGYLIKSPCRECRQHMKMPTCMSSCEILDRIQSKLAGVISCSISKDSIESSAMSCRGWEGK